LQLDSVNKASFAFVERIALGLMHTAWTSLTARFS
jgi:hypothetical protein